MAEPIAARPPVGGEVSPAASSGWNALLFAGLVLAICAWALSLPLFPTQDGPIHKYYVHVIASLLSGSHAYGAYAIRHPLPPYVIHYAVLLGLTKYFSIDLAEKLFVCLIFVVSAYSFRYCARSFGPSGTLLSLCMVPLILHWSVVMGFLNYSLAVGLFFLAVGLRQRAAEGRRVLWLPFLLVVALLTVTHPVPLLLLVVFSALDILIRVMQSRANGTGSSFGVLRWRYLAFAATCIAFLYPLASADRSQSVSNLHLFGLHRDALIGGAALSGISLFDTRSTNLLILLYRLGLYMILLGAVWLAASGLRGRWRAGSLRSSDTLLLCALLLLVAIPFLPQTMNGSDYFAQRLMIFPWLVSLIAASAYPAPARLRHLAPAFAVAMTAITLLPTEIFIRPVANQLASLEAQSLPAHFSGLAVVDPAMLKAVRVQHQLGFNPYVWSGVLPFLHANDVMLNSPFLDQTITPLKVVPGSDLLLSKMHSQEEARRLVDGNVNLPDLSPGLRSPLLASTHVIVFVATPQDVAQGLAPLIGPAASAAYTCTNHSWYLVCTR